MSRYVRHLKPGMTREELVALWGEPDEKGYTAQKCKEPSVFKYGPVEVTFNHANGRLIYVWVRDAADVLRILLPGRGQNPGMIKPHRTPFSEYDPLTDAAETLFHYSTLRRQKRELSQKFINRRARVLRRVIKRCQVELAAIEPHETEAMGPENGLAESNK